MTTKSLSNLTHVITRATKPRILLALLLLAATTAAFAAKSNQSPLPKKPAALLALAAQHNGLASPNLKPWHIEATYQTYDPQGNPAEKGTFNEWWAAPNRYKAIFKTANTSTTLYVSPKGAYLAGPMFGLAGFNILRWLVEPIPDQGHYPGADFKMKSRSVSGVRLVCVTLYPTKSEVQKENLRTGAYCFDRNQPVLRLAQVQFNGEAVYERLATLGSRNIGDVVKFTLGKTLFETVHLVSGEVIPVMNPSLTRMPPQAAGHIHPITGHISYDFLIHTGKIIAGRPPVYPAFARSTNSHGVVKMRVTIEKDGTVQNIKVISSPSPALSKAAMQAVRTWRYQPSTFAGRPMKVRKIISVTYSLDGRS